jgi:WD40 repeat protein
VLRLAELLLLSTTGRLKAALALLLAAGVTLAGFGLAATSTSRPAPASPREAEPTASEDEPIPPSSADPKQPRKDVHGDPLPPGALARMGTTRFRLPYESFPAMAISPDRTTIASIDDSGNIHLWDAATGRETYGERVRFQDGKQAQSRYYVHAALAFSPDGKTLLAGMNRSTMVRGLCLWDVEKRAVVRRFDGVSNGFVTAAASPDFKRVAAVADQTVLVWDAASGELVRSWESFAVTDAAGLCFSADGKALAFGDKDGTIHLCEIDGKKETKLKAPGPVAALAFDKDGKLLASASKRTVVLWDAASGEEVRRFDVERVEGTDDITGDVSHLAFSPDGRTLAVSVQFRRIELRDPATGRKRATLYGDCNRQCVFSADGKWLGAAARERLILWDAATGSPLYPGHDNQVNGLWFSPDDKTLISFGGDKMCFWDAASGKQTAERGVNWWPALSADTRLAADSYARGKEIRVQETASGKTLHVLKHKERFAPQLLSPDGKTLVVSYSGNGTQTLALWDVASGKELHELSLHKGYAGPLALSPDGKLLASFDPALELNPPPPPMKRFPAPDDVPQARTCLRIWDVKTGAKRLEIPLRERLRNLVFSPDGRLLLTSDWDHSRVCVRETATGKEVRSWVAAYPWNGEEAQAIPSWIDALAVSPDGRTVAAGVSPNGTNPRAALMLWDAESGQELRRFPLEGKSQVDSLAFSRDGKRLASGGMRDGMVVVWDVADVTGRPRPKALDLTERERDDLWERLADGDAAKGRDGLARLARGGDGAARLIAARVKDLPAAPGALTAKRLAELLKELDSDDFETREAATRELAAADAKAGDELRRLLKADKLSAEVRRRIESAVEQIDTRSSGVGGPALRWLRAVEVLERVGTPEARKVLKKIAAADGPIADEAHASLERVR